MARTKGLRWELVADDKTGRAFDSLRRRIGLTERGFSRLKTVVAGALAAFSVRGISRFIAGQVEAADKLDKLSLKLGASVEALSQYQHVADITGVSFDTLTMAWQRATRRIAEAAVGTGEARGALAELGLEAGALAKLAPEDQFEIIADAMAEVEDESTKLRLAFKLFDSEGVAVLQTMEGGSKAIQDLRREAEKLGKSFSERQVGQLVAAKDAWTRLKATLEGLGRSLVINLGPALQAVAEFMAKAIPTAANFVSRTFDNLMQAIILFSQTVLVNLAKTLEGADALLGGFTDKFANLATKVEDTILELELLRREFDPAFQSGTAAVDSFSGALERNRALWRDVSVAAEETGATTEQVFARVSAQAEAELERTNKSAEDLTKAAGDLARDAIQGQITSWGDLGTTALRVLSSILVKQLEVNAAAAVTGGGIAGLFGRGLSFIAGLFGGGGGFNAERTSSPGGIGGFAQGGSFLVGGSGGSDSQRVSFMASPNETVTVSRPGQAGAAGTTNNFTVDLSGASAEAVADLRRLVLEVNGSIERRALGAVEDRVRRGGQFTRNLRG